jgi:protein SCO1/2
MTQVIRIILVLVLGAATIALGQDSVPAEIEGVDVVEKLDTQVPLDAPLMNEMGQQVTLRDCLAEGKPAVLQLGYFGCPMLCDQVSQGLLKSMKELDLNIGTDFNFIYISFDHRETRVEAYQKKLSYQKQYERDGAGEGWHFLVGSKVAVQTIADAVGFKYKWVESSQQFSHPAVLIVLTPEGRASRYLYGVQFPKRTLQLSLVEASEGKIGSTIDRVMMFCFKYDPSTGRYTVAATNLMRLGGVLTAIILGSWIARMLVKERRGRLGST